MEKSKINVLIISVYFPPIQSIASNRLYSFAKYLDKNKTNVFVNTIEEKNNISDIDLSDINVIRIKNNSLFKPLKFDKKTNKFTHYAKVFYNRILSIIIDDPYSKWISNSYKTLKYLITKKNIDVIISSYAPVASHKLALKLKKEFPHLKWIADMRDEMGNNPFLSDLERKKLKKLEKEILNYCDAVTSVSNPILNNFRIIAGDRAKNIKFREIRNGFDFDIDINNINHKNKIFTISYIGSFYGKRNPSTFFKALIEIDQNILENIKIRFVGLTKPINIPEKLISKVEILPKVEHSKAINLMKESDALLLLHPKIGKGIYTGKIFEYLASLRPIIALVDKEDVAAKLIKEANAGYIADFDNIYEIKKIIKQAYIDWKENKTFDFNIDLIKKHHRKEQAKILENLIFELVK
ncbi:hypothetical protein [Persephonella sp.]